MANVMLMYAGGEFEDYQSTILEEDEDDDEEAPLRPKIKRKPPIVHKWNM